MTSMAAVKREVIGSHYIRRNRRLAYVGLLRRVRS